MIDSWDKGPPWDGKERCFDWLLRLGPQVVIGARDVRDRDATAEHGVIYADMIVGEGGGEGEGSCTIQLGPVLYGPDAESWTVPRRRVATREEALRVHERDGRAVGALLIHQLGLCDLKERA